MSSIPHKKALILGLSGAVALALIAWVVGGRIRSPAQVAADTAPPEPSLITVPVERRTLSTEVIVRGTVRYGAPQGVVLATSPLKQGSEIVSRPPRAGARLRDGAVAMSVSGRPVFVLTGAQPMHRDLAPGTAGPDVRQLEEALRRFGLDPGTVDETYDGATGAAVAAWYQRGGWTPFGVTDLQSDQLRAAQVSASSARDAVLQARLALRTAATPATPAEINQARTDAVTAQEAADAAQLAVVSARVQVEATTDAVTRARAAVSLATATSGREAATAEADLVTKQAALNTAIDAQAAAQRELDAAPADATPADLETLRAALRQAVDAVGVARSDVTAATAVAAAARASAPASVDQARADERTAIREAGLATAQLARARAALAPARRQAALARTRISILSARGSTDLQSEIVAGAQSDLARADAEVARLQARIGVQVPADELLFFPSLPLRVDAVGVKRGATASGRVMTVSNSQLAADSSLSINDSKLVRVGAPVTIEEQDLAIRLPGTVTRIADRPGTNKVDPTRVYFEVTPRTAPTRLVGASVKLTIAVQSTKGAVLAVPLSALSVAADGRSRVKVDLGSRGGGYVIVTPGLAANGLVEVRPLRPRELKAGDLVVVGAGGSIPSGTGAGSGSTPLPGVTSPGTTTLPSATAPGTP